MLSWILLLQPERPSIGGGVIFIWLLWRLHQVLKHSRVLMKRKNTLVVEYPTWLGSWISGLRYLWAGPDILLENHKPGVPYAVRTPEAYYVHLSSESQIKELIDAPEEKLSLHALSKDMFQPKYTMNGLEVEDQMNANGNLHSRALRVILSSHLNDLQPALDHIISDTFTEEFFSGRKLSGHWMQLQSFSMAKRVITAANSLVFFGDHLSRDPEFLKAALDYPEDLLITAEILHFVPSVLAPYAGPILMRQHRASKVLVDHLTPLIEERLEEKKSTHNHACVTHLDFIEFLIETNTRRDHWSSKKIVQVILGIWFASVHQPALSLVYALDDLCRHPEYVEPLRKEIETCDNARGDVDSLPLLDSFLKESARLHPSDSISVRRKVLEPYTLSDGTHLAVGDIACVPLQAIMRDPAIYPDGLSFDAFRFVGQNGSGNTARFTDTSTTFPLWGLGKHACPGRFYAARVLKLTLAHVLRNYVVEMDKHAKGTVRNFHWRSAIIPKPGTTLMFRRRCDSWTSST